MLDISRRGQEIKISKSNKYIKEKKGENSEMEGNKTNEIFMQRTQTHLRGLNRQFEDLGLFRIKNRIFRIIIKKKSIIK